MHISINNNFEHVTSCPKYLGHVIRMAGDRLPRTVLEWQPEGTRRRGKPKNTLRRTYQRDLKHINAIVQPQWEDVWAAAHMRDDWRLFLDALGASGGTGGTKVKVKVLVR